MQVLEVVNMSDPDEAVVFEAFVNKMPPVVVTAFEVGAMANIVEPAFKLGTADTCVELTPAIGLVITLAGNISRTDPVEFGTLYIWFVCGAIIVRTSKN